MVLLDQPVDRDQQTPPVEQSGQWVACGSIASDRRSTDALLRFVDDVTARAAPQPNTGAPRSPWFDLEDREVMSLSNVDPIDT